MLILGRKGSVQKHNNRPAMVFFKLTVYVLNNKTGTFFFNSINAKTHFKLFKKLVNSVK